MDELISVVIPVYNVEEYLDNCIKSVLSQTYRNLEIILVDDGATDNSGYMCDTYAKEDIRVQVIHKQNGGLSDARNKGIIQATGNYLLFIDSDDVIAPNFVEYLYNLIVETSADIGICDPVHCYPRKEISYANETERHVFDREEAICEMLYQNSFLVSAWGKIYRKEYFSDIEFPFGMLFEDSAIMYKLFDKAQKISYGNAKLYGYMHREGSITMKKFSERDCDILIICTGITKYMESYSVAFQKAAASYQVVGALRIYLNAPNEGEFKSYITESLNIIRKNGRAVLLDARARKKTRIALLMFFVARPLMRLVHKRINRWK